MKITEEFIKKYFEEEEYNVVKIDKTNITYVCSCFNESSTSLDSFMNGNRCCNILLNEKNIDVVTRDEKKCRSCNTVTENVFEFVSEIMGGQILMCESCKIDFLKKYKFSTWDNLKNYINEKINWDSNGELHFKWYLDELIEKGFVEYYLIQPSSLLLSEKTDLFIVKKNNIDSTNLLHQHEYTPDFIIVWTELAKNIFYTDSTNYNKKIPFYANNRPNQYNIKSDFTIIEIKPSFDYKNMTRLFTINQKWVYSKFNMYVQKITPEKLFEQTFTPNAFLTTDKTTKDRKIKFKTKTIYQFLGENNENINL
jgi:hypothetical protein